MYFLLKNKRSLQKCIRNAYGYKAVETYEISYGEIAILHMVVKRHAL